MDRAEPTAFAKPGIAYDPFLTSEFSEGPLPLKSVVERPVEVANFIWAETDAVFDELHSSTYPDQLFYNDNIRSKVDYFTYFRANVRVKVVVNSTPFMVGKLWMFFAPYQNAQYNPVATLTEASGYPGAELDIGTSQSMELVIPYCSPLSAISLPTAEGTIGDFKIVVFNQLKSAAGTEDVSVSVFANFEDVVLELPTALPCGFPASPPVAQAIEPQSGDWIIEPQVDEGEDKSKEGVISGVAGQVAKVSKPLSGLPIIGGVAKAVTWVADAVGGVAKFFGFNKPTSVIANYPISNTPGKGWTNMDGLDTSVVLAASPVNETETRQHVFSSQVDEMDISYIAKKSCFVKTYNWAVTDTTGTILAAIPVNPGVCVNLTTPTGSLKQVGFVGWLASVFELWRGSLVYRISFAKNAFYSGRLRLSFVPQADNTLGTGMDFNQCRNWVIDLSGNSFEITVPWVYNYPWAKADPGSITASVLAEGHSTGVLFVTVLNELKAPTTVPQNIDFNLWLSGGDDLEFAVPSLTETFTSFGSLSETLEKVGRDDIPEQLIEAQVDDGDDGLADHDEQNRPSTNPILESQTHKAPIDPAAMCIGERVTNLRQIIKRFTMVGQIDVGTDLVTPAATLIPGQFYTGHGDQSRNYLANIAQIYRFWKGGMRYKLWYHHPQYYSGNAQEPLFGAVLPQLQNGDYTTSTAWSWDSTTHTNNQFMHFQNPMLNQVLEVQAPWYNTNPMAVIDDDTIMDHQYQPRVFIMATGETTAFTQKMTLYQAAADDMTFGYLVGPPGLYYNSPTTVPP